MQLRISFVLPFIFFFSGLNAFPNGAPLGSCSTMIPKHGVDPDNTTSPYETITDLLQIAQGGSVGLTLQNITGQTYYFNGYLTMAFDITKPDEVKPVGTFSSPSNGKTLDCFGLPKSAITQIDESRKENVTAIWKAPPDFLGTVVFKTTWIRGKKKFWPKVPSLPVVVGIPEVKKIN